MTSGGAAAVRAFNQRIAAPGARWYYASAETYILALVLRAALGRSLASYFQDRIWRPIGAEAPASWLIDASGCELGYSGFHAVLRDYARLGRMLADRGRVGGREIIPDQIFRNVTHPHFSASATGRYYGYGQQVWIFPDDSGSFALLGVRGQMLLVDPRTRSYLVHSAARPEARDPRSSETLALWRAVLKSA
jgi:CubicO group peptidase (beta-lactamase class C family)